MSHILDLLETMAAEEEAFAERSFVAPCIAGGRVRTRIGGIVQTFAPEPADFAGWGVFQVQNGRAVLLEEADLPLQSAYLRNFPILRLRLTRSFDGGTWLAYPANEGDMRQRFGATRPIVVHLVTEGARFEQITAHNIGGSWWFAEVDRRADPTLTEQLREAFRQLTQPDALTFPGLTPEMRTAYDLAAQVDPAFVRRQQQLLACARRQAARAERAQREEQARQVQNAAMQLRHHEQRWDRNAPREARDEQRLRQALQTGGGHLRDFNDRGDFYLVEWTTADGILHTSAVTKNDLTVISSGICLSGRDRDFDLQSLVGVIEARGY
jgi:hypothetical protein